MKEKDEGVRTTFKLPELTSDWVKENVNDFVLSPPLIKQAAETLFLVPEALITPELLKDMSSFLIQKTIELQIDPRETELLLERIAVRLKKEGELPPERLPEDDQEAVDWVRESLVELESRNSVLVWDNPTGKEVSRLIESIQEDRTRKGFIREIENRTLFVLLTNQWINASGSDKKINDLLSEKTVVLEPERLVEMSRLFGTREGVSLSVHISRAINVYCIFLGHWAKGFIEGEKAAEIYRAEKMVGKEEEELSAEERDKIEMEAEKVRWQASLEAAEEAQFMLASLSIDNSGRVRDLNQNGVSAGYLKGLFSNLWRNPELAAFKRALIERVRDTPNSERFPLSELLGINIFVQKENDLDTAWTKFLVGGLAGSADGASLALKLLEFTGETDEMNVTWTEGAYSATDYQKLLRAETRRLREAAEDNPHGPDATLGHFPERSGKGWFRRAKIKMALANDSTERPRNLTVEQWISGEWDDEEQRWMREPVPFHQINWRGLSKNTYISDFLSPNARSFTTYQAIITRDFGHDNGMEAFHEDKLYALNKAFKSAWGRKETFIKRYGEEFIEGFPSWVRYSPWVWWAIGAISLYNPWGKKLPGMRDFPDPTQRWPETSTIRSDDTLTSSYENTIIGGLRVSNFLTEGEMRFVTKYIKGQVI